MSYNSLLPLLKKTKSPLTVQEFQSVVNVVFHDYEAAHYDQMHTDMWGSLQEQINLLIENLFENESISTKKMKLLDVGCGTGLSTQILLESRLGPFIDSITLLDTSSNMLKQAEIKAQKWGKAYTLINSDIQSIQESYDVIIICSVLHHIPDLENFLIQIDRVLKPRGFLIHLQDPNGDFLNDPIYIQRQNEYKKALDLIPKAKKMSDFIPKKWKNYINRQIGRKSYIDLVNDQLIAKKIIRKRMTADEIWSVTDIHVETKQNTINKGISLRFLLEQFPNFNLINQRSYGFYGYLKSDLLDTFKIKEEAFIAKNERNGRNISCIWKKNQ